MILNPNDLRIDTYLLRKGSSFMGRSQVVGVRVTHMPTGVTASYEDAQSTHRNKHLAMREVEYRLRARLPKISLRYDHGFGRVLWQVSMPGWYKTGWDVDLFEKAKDHCHYRNVLEGRRDGLLLPR